MPEPHDPIVTVRAGGVAPLKSKLPEGERASPVSARAYVHPAIADRVIVRLEPDTVAAGADAEMAALGFGEPEIEEQLGQMRYRTLGFPAWPLVNDPKKARFALEVTQEFRKAKKRAASKPGHAKEGFDEIAKKLGRTVPHFLPSFWEECGRVLADQGANAMAAQCFEKAREAERAHKLKVDEDARDAVFVEFALLGAVAAKTLSAYAKDLEKSAGAKDAYRRFRTIVVQRALGGMPPWSGMGKDLRALAKAAKLDLDKEDDALVRELVDSPALRRAPGEFWATYRPALLRLGKDPHIRARLRAVFPEPRSNDDDGKKKFVAEWFGLLEEIAAFDDLPDAELADFVSRAIKYGGHIEPVRKLIPRFAKRLVALDAKLKVWVGDWYEEISLDFAEQALAHGVQLAEPKDSDGDEMRFEDDDYTCDPIHVSKDPVYGKLLVDFVENHVGEADHETKMRGKEGFRAARRAWLEGEIQDFSQGLRLVGDTLDTLSEKTTAATFLEFPDLHERIAEVKLGPALERTLRAGIADELGWDAYEKAFEGLGEKVGLEGYFPYVVAHDGVHARVVGPEGLVLKHDFAIDIKKEKLEHAIYLDGDLIVFFEDKKSYDDKAYWAKAPKDRFELRLYLSGFGWQTPLAGGGITVGHLPVRAGDHKIEDDGRDYDHDGQTFFVQEWDDGNQASYEWDPLTNKKGRKSRPTFFEQYLEEGKTLDTDACSLHVAPEGLTTSLLGIKDGLLGIRARKKDDLYEVERIDGVKWSGKDEHITPEALILFPGDDRPRILDSTEANDKRWLGGEIFGVDLHGPDGEHLASLNDDAWASCGWGRVPLPPLEMWHFLSYRDEAQSKRLRTIDKVEALMIEDAAKREAAIRARGITHEKLVKGVSGIVEHAIALEKRLAELVADRSKEAAERAPVAGGGDKTNAVRKLAEALVKQKPMVIEDFPEELRQWLVSARGKAARARMPFSEESELNEAKEMMAGLSGTLFEEDLSSMRLMDLEEEEDREEDEDIEWGALQVVRDGGSMFGLDSSNDWAIERSTDGTWRMPKGFKVTKDKRLARGPGAAFLRAWLALEDKRAEWEPAFADKLAERTGLSRAEAVLLAAGLPNIGDYSRDFLGKERREKLGLKVTEADPARGLFREMDSDDLDALFGAAIGDDPASVVTPLAPDASGKSFADRLGDAWLAKFGKRVEMPEGLLESAQKDLDLGHDLHRTMSAFLAPDSVPNLAFVEQPLPKVVWGRDEVQTFDSETAKRLLLASAWLSYAQPVGDPARAGISALFAKMRSVLANEKVLWPFGYTYSDHKERKDILDALKLVPGDKVELPPDDETVCDDARDDGVLLVAIYERRLLAAFRPAKVKRWDAPVFAAIRKAINDSEDGDDEDAFGVARTLLSDSFAALAQRVSESKLENGQFEANPLHSAPRTVAAVKKELGVSEDAAALYLQLLALAEPTDKAIRRFNDWTPKRHQTAQAELVKKKLVTEGKRERAGREVFLPGGFGKGSGKDLPMEDWKKPFYPNDLGRHLPLEPMHALFARTWKRVESGDAPKLEKVR